MYEINCCCCCAYPTAYTPEKYNGNSLEMECELTEESGKYNK